MKIIAVLLTIFISSVTINSAHARDVVANSIEPADGFLMVAKTYENHKNNKGIFEYCVKRESSIWTSRCLNYAPADEYLKSALGRDDVIYVSMGFAPYVNQIILFYRFGE